MIESLNDFHPLIQDNASMSIRNSLMRIVSWNCRQAFHLKWPMLESLRWDIAVLQECAHPEILIKKGAPFQDYQAFWAGRHIAELEGKHNKGLAIFIKEGWSANIFSGWAEIRSKWQDRLDILIPIEVDGPLRFNLLAVWSFNNRDHKEKIRLQGPVQVALSELKDWLHSAPTMIIGDFNTNVIWDSLWQANKFSLTLALLKELGFLSVYHELSKEEYGSEKVPTLFWQKVTEDGPQYHIDYIFIPQNWHNKATRLSIGQYKDWCGSGKSDHVPLVLDMHNSLELSK